MEILIAILAFTFIIGTIIGSFLNVVALRGLSGESIVLPPSKCPQCGNKLKPWHNIPILSYLFLRGKCAFCKGKISPQYPIVEFLTGLLFVATLIKFQPSLYGLFMIIVFCTLFVMSITDIKEKVICAGHAWFLIIFGIICNIVLSMNYIDNQLTATGHFLYKTQNFLNLPIVSSIEGLLAGVIIMEVLSGIGFLLVGKRAFGKGDTYIAAGIGAMFGLGFLLEILAISIAVQVGMVSPSFFKKLAANKDTHTIVSLVVFLLAAVGFSVANIYGLLENYIVCIAASVILAILGIYACIRVILGIKKSGEVTMFPFGPAMTIATLITMFLIAKF